MIIECVKGHCKYQKIATMMEKQPKLFLWKNCVSSCHPAMKSSRQTHCTNCIIGGSTKSSVMKVSLQVVFIFLMLVFTSWCQVKTGHCDMIFNQSWKSQQRGKSGRRSKRKLRSTRSWRYNWRRFGRKVQSGPGGNRINKSCHTQTGRLDFRGFQALYHGLYPDESTLKV